MYARPKRKHVHREPTMSLPSVMACNGLDLIDRRTGAASEEAAA